MATWGLWKCLCLMPMGVEARCCAQPHCTLASPLALSQEGSLISGTLENFNLDGIAAGGAYMIMEQEQN